MIMQFVLEIILQQTIQKKTFHKCFFFHCQWKCMYDTFFMKANVFSFKCFSLENYSQRNLFIILNCNWIALVPLNNIYPVSYLSRHNLFNSVTQSYFSKLVSCVRCKWVYQFWNLDTFKRACISEQWSFSCSSPSLKLDKEDSVVTCWPLELALRFTSPYIAQ